MCSAVRITGGEALVRSLEVNGVRRVFGIPGVQLDHAADALYHAGDDIAFICARNEQAVSYMADGCARSTGRVGVSMVVPGPGMLNGLAGLATAVGRADLDSDLRYLAGQPELTRLRLDLRGIDPDVASSHVALEKGYLFLRAIAESAGAERFAGFLRDFLAAFRFCSVTSEEVVAFARERLPGAVDYDEWLHGTGLPAGTPAVVSPLLDAVSAIGQAAPEPDVAATRSVDEWQVYLAGLQPPVPAGLLAELDSRHHLTASANPEILRLWLTAALRSGYLAAVPAAVDLLGRVGRLKFLKPLYDALARNPDTCVLAQECFERNRSRYHPIAVTVIGTRLSQAPCGN